MKTAEHIEHRVADRDLHLPMQHDQGHSEVKNESLTETSHVARHEYHPTTKVNTPPLPPTHSLTHAKAPGHHHESLNKPLHQRK
eukprot:1273187-Amphidinium_carterae.1